MAKLGKVEQYVKDMKRGMNIDLNEYPKLKEEMEYVQSVSVAKGMGIGYGAGQVAGMIGVIAAGTTWFKGCVVIIGVGLGGIVVGGVTGYGVATINEAAKLGRNSDLKLKAIDILHTVVGG